MKLNPTPETLQANNHEDKAELCESVKRFKKPFEAQFANIYILSVLFALVFPLLSVCLGTFFISDLLFNIIKSVTPAFGIAAILLILWELAKYFFLTTTLEMYFGSKRYWFITGAILLIFQAGSIFYGILGAEKIYEYRDNKKQVIESKFIPLIDSISKSYDLQIAANNNEIIMLSRKAQKQWNGINTPEQYKLISDLKNSNLELLKLKSTETKEINGTKDLQLFEAAKSSGYNVKYFIIISIIIEIIIFAAGFFLVFYDFKKAKKKELSSEKIEILTEDMIEYIYNIRNFNSGRPVFNIPKVEIPENLERKKAGFQIGQNSNKINAGVISTPTVGTKFFKKFCPKCGKEFTTEIPAKKFCCETCRVMYNEQK